MAIRVLHVINDISADMRYGGPAMNCLRHSKFLESEETSVTVWGSYSGTPLSYGGKSKIFRKNRVFIPRYRFTFQFGLGNFLSLFKAINNSDLVHVHFAREMNPVLASLIAIFLKKKLILQTHGMIVKNPKLFYMLWDYLFTIRIFLHAAVVLPLQKNEELDLREFPINRSHIVPNGIEISDSFQEMNNRNGIVFMSRIHERKRPGIFLDASVLITDRGYPGNIGIYGEDSGYLVQLLELLESKELSSWYRGGVSHQQAIEILSASELLILPSYLEPFPMVVLESLIVGTPVVIMTDCGIADIVTELDPLFVCSSNPEDIAINTYKILAKYASIESRIELSVKARNVFSITRTIDGFNEAYAIATSGDENA